MWYPFSQLDFNSHKKKECFDMSNMDVAFVREAVESNIGKRVRIRFHAGKRKFHITEGVLSKTYPSIFLVKVGGEGKETQMVSYTYSDVITKEVQMMLC